MRASLVAALLLVASPAGALPRFAVRSGLPCGSCHVTPTGGGQRTPFARNVFARQWLAPAPSPDSAVLSPEMQVTEHVALGADLRAGYIFQNSARPEIQDVSSLALMQADLYVNVDVPRHLVFYLDTGVYGGFEAWGGVRPFVTAGERDLLIRAGRFIVPFGLRDVNHATYVREGVGFGPTDRDNGVEADLTLGRITAQAAITNGTYGSAFFDIGGTRYPHPYDGALSARFTYQPRILSIQTLVALSAMYNMNAAQQNPLFVPAMFPGQQIAQISEGVDELRLGLAAGAAFGRLGYRGELVVVRDEFERQTLRKLWGYASHQEISVIPFAGLELLATYEFADSDLEFRRGRVERVGGGVEWFPVPSLELSIIARHSFGRADYLIGTRDDVIAQLHLFL